MRSLQMKSVLVATSVLMLAGLTAASAHPKVVSAEPAVDGTVSAAPSEVTVRFNERLESSFSSLVIRDADGKQVDKKDSKLDRSDRRILRVSVPTLTPGLYKVEWHAMSADTHKVEGDFTFRVSP
jgi:methionine-rich copper-binding protein CopC